LYAIRWSNTLDWFLHSSFCGIGFKFWFGNLFSWFYSSTTTSKAKAINLTFIKHPKWLANVPFRCYQRNHPTLQYSKVVLVATIKHFKFTCNNLQFTHLEVSIFLLIASKYDIYHHTYSQLFGNYIWSEVVIIKYSST